MATRRVFELVASLALGGAERVAVEIAAGLVPHGWQAELVCLGADSATSDYEHALEREAASRGVTVHRVPYTSIGNGRSRRAFRAFMRTHRPDLLHVHSRPHDWQVAMLGKAFGIPVVYSVHLPYELTKARQRRLYQAAAHTVPAVVCVSQAVADHIHISERVPRRKLSVIYNGIRTALSEITSPEQRARKRDEMGWSTTDDVWFCAARLDHQKGQEFLIDAMSRLPATSRARLVLAGDGARRAAFEQQVDALGLRQRVTFLGTRNDVPELLGAADGYVSASRQEGHPLAILEAMAAGLPVVAPRLHSITEIATGQNPVFFGPDLAAAATDHCPEAIAQAMVRVERDSGEIRERARKERDTIRARFSMKTMVQQHACLYDAVLNR